MCSNNFFDNDHPMPSFQNRLEYMTSSLAINRILFQIKEQTHDLSLFEGFYGWLQ